MRRVLLALTAAVASSAVLAGGAGGTHSDGTGPKKDLVAGTGTLTDIPQGFPQNPMVHVNADSNPVTGEVHGHWFVRYPTTTPGGGFDMRGDVVCVDVVGVHPFNHATVIGRIDRVKGQNPFPLFGLPATFEPGQFLQIRIRDWGEPGTLDGANFGGGQASQPNCFDKGGEQPLSQGNFIAHNDPPVQLLSFLDALLAEFEAAAGDH
jgi:hypothetical protein